MTPSLDFDLRGRGLWTVIAVGLVSGFLAGLFGIGGGTMIVPALVLIGMSQRHASATSLAAIVPTSIVGVVTYGVQGDVHWVSAVLLTVGVLGGVQIGTLLLARLPEKALQWGFVGFLVLLIVVQLTQVPERTSNVHITVLTALALVAMGFVAGILAGLFGIGGGTILVPGMATLFHASDLTARGTSLLAMLPGAATGTVSNAKRGLVHLRTGLIIGAAACLTTPAGNIVANHASPRVNGILFASYLALLVLGSLWVALFRKDAK
ncbi:MAG: sulfite exporter TauE/SafE family protein [Cellulomonadaceae bacterium]